MEIIALICFAVVSVVVVYVLGSTHHKPQH